MCLSFSRKCLGNADLHLEWVSCIDSGCLSSALYSSKLNCLFEGYANSSSAHQPARSNQ